MDIDFIIFQPQSQQYSLPLVLALGGILGALLTGLINFFISLYKTIQTTRAEEIKTYSQLIGKKNTLLQTLFTCGDYRAVIEYNQAIKNYLENNYKNDTLAIRYIADIEKIDPDIRKYHDRAIQDVTKARECWWKEAGLIQALFNNCDLKKTLMEKAEEIERCERNIDNFIEKLEEVNDKDLENITLERTANEERLIIRCPWLKDTEKELHRLIDEKLEKRIDDFLQIITGHIYDVKWWQIWKI